MTCPSLTCAIPKQVVPDTGLLENLLNMGFNRDSAATALQQCHNHQAKAIEKLVSWGQAARAHNPGSASSRNKQGRIVSQGLGDSVTGEGRSQPAADAASLLAEALRSSKSGTGAKLITCLASANMFACTCWTSV